MKVAPIALFVYNRPDHLVRTLTALRRNPEAAWSRLYIFSDGPRSGRAGDEDRVAEVRRVARDTGGFQEVLVEESAINRGLAASIIRGVGQVVNRHGEVIVLEDDLVTSPVFLRFMNEALAFYRDCPEIISIHGYVYPATAPLPPVFFIRGADCWGWATWKRGWDLFEADGSTLLRQLKKKGLAYQFNFSDSYPYVRLLEDQIAGRNDSWAIRWYASAFLAGKLTLYPGRTLVQNIGFDGSGTHCSASEISGNTGELSSEPLNPRLLDLRESARAREAFTEYFFRSSGKTPSPKRRPTSWWRRWLEGRI